MKDVITLSGIFITLGIASANLAYTIWSSRKTSFINVVTSSRIKWIESLRDKVSQFIAVSYRIMAPASQGQDAEESFDLLRELDVLQHQIILHLNPDDTVDNRIRELVQTVHVLTIRGEYSDEFEDRTTDLRTATGEYLHKEWARVKQEAKYGEHA